MDQSKKDKTISAVSTLCIMLLTILLCSWLGYKLPDPPIEEEGMGVAGEVLGEIEGLGNNDNATFDDGTAAPAPAASTPDESFTTGQEPTPVAKATKKDDKPAVQKKTETAPASNDNSTASDNSSQSTTNPNATFKGRNKGNGSEGKGTMNGGGQAGSTDGTQGAQGSGKGNGAGYSLGNRGLRGTLPMPSYTSTKDGDVVVRIKVNRNGEVVDVEAPYKGSKNHDKAMVEEAKKAAKNAKFTADPNATEYQYGTITYHFRHIG